MKNPTISVVINTFNEEANIKKCIESVTSLADEIIVCDMYSDDNTVAIATSLGATVIYYEKAGFVEPARYFAISSATCDWIFVIDADEYIKEDVTLKLKELVKNTDADLITIGKLYFYFVHYVKKGGFYLKSSPLFFKKSLYINGFTPENLKIFKSFTHLKGTSKHTIDIGDAFYIWHDAYPTIEKFVVKTNGKYAFIEAEQLFADGIKFSVIKMLYDPTKTFFKKYLFQKGFLEGINGLILCVLYANYRFNVWANLWQIENNKK